MSWLENFPPEEKQYGELLLNSLRIISESNFRASLTSHLSSFADKAEKPIAMYPIREIPAESQGSDKVGSELTGGAIMHEVAALHHPYAQLPGSEGAVGHIIRDLIGSRPDTSIISSPHSLKELRQARPRTIVLVDDYSGTGQRIANYIDAWVRHKTIRSWHSYNLIKFHVVVLAASWRAHDRLNSNQWIESLNFIEQAADFNTARWTRDEREGITGICIKYGKMKNLALGFQEAGGLLAFQHTVPNNMPAILWQNSGRKTKVWKPFFANRVMSPELQHELGDYRLEIRADRIAAYLRQLRLARSLADQPHVTTRLALLVLAAAARGVRDIRRLSVLLGTTMASAEATQKACRQLELLDAVGRLTDAGRNELARARTRVQKEKMLLIYDNSSYYPKQLRGVSDV